MLTTVESIAFPEIVLGMVAPVGVDISSSTKNLKAYFKRRKYNVHEIKISASFKKLKRHLTALNDLDFKDEHERYEKFIKFGNGIREHFDDDAILAVLSIFEIIQKRLSVAEKVGPSERYSRNVFIITQFKRQEEIDLMRAVYGQIFFQLSVYSRRAARVKSLAKKFAKSKGQANWVGQRSKAEEIIIRDENELNEKHGQRISKVFHDADFIINADLKSPSISKQVNRFCDLLFSSNIISPTKIEYGMFAAKSAALRSVDLSRQVGAAIFRPSGEIVSMGSNEVPKAGGGTYWTDEEFDDRDFSRGKDPNVERKDQLLNEILDVLDVKLENLKPKQIKRIEKSGFMSALEYGRIVHAEMSAISDAARLSIAVKDCILYSTTFPCHLCAKHIVAAGLKEVVFLEPYPKSLAQPLHEDSICIEGEDRGGYDDYPAVSFNHFYGVTPRRYRVFFEKGSRKNKTSGKLEKFPSGKRKPIVSVKSPYYVQIEDTAVSSIMKYLG